MVFASLRIVVLLQSLKIYLPRRILRNWEVWVDELQADILDVIAECRTHQSSDILKNECTWPQLTDRSNSLGKHVSLIVISIRFATHRKRLTWRTACHEVDGTKIREIHFPDIRFNNAPLWTIQPQRCTSIFIPFDQCDGLESGTFKPKC